MEQEWNGMEWNRNGMEQEWNGMELAWRVATPSGTTCVLHDVANTRHLCRVEPQGIV